jgi:parallel beta-helix repeat protein
MKHWLAAPSLILGICAIALTGLIATPALAQGPVAQASKGKKAVFEACKHGCRYRTIQKAVDAAGSFKFKSPKAKVVVAIRPGKYVEGVVVDGTERRMDFEGLTIEGTKKDRKRVILEGKNAKGELGAAQNGIEVISVDGVVLRNMWARNFQSNGFFVHASREEGQHCVGYTMDNLLASGNRSYGLFAKNCFGGKMVNSAGYHQGDSGFYVGETPCDKRNWNVYKNEPCQRKPQWTLLKNDRSYENVLGYSGTNSKYVRIVESAFYNNGAGIVPNTLDSEGFEPNGWNIIERNDVFWNNYNYFLAASKFKTVSEGLGELGGQTVNYPTGVGIVLYGGDGNIVRRNKVFGNYKWGVASFSGPGETFVANEGNEAKNVNNQITENTMGREGADPNGEYDFWNDDTGGGNCWSGNNLIATFAPGNGTVPLSSIYPLCPQAPVAYATARSINTSAGLQVILAETGNPKTILGYAGTSPPQNQQCTWVRRVASHPPFQNYKPVEVVPRPGEVTCG